MRYRTFPYLLVLAILTGACLSGDEVRTSRVSPPEDVNQALVWEHVWTAFGEGGVQDGVRPQREPVEFGSDRTLSVRRPDTMEVVDIANGRVIRTLETSRSSLLETDQVNAIFLQYRENSFDPWAHEDVRRNGYLRAYDVTSGSRLWQQRGTLDHIVHPGEEVWRDSQSSVLAFTERGLVWHEGVWSTGMERRTGRTVWTQKERRSECSEDRRQDMYAVTRNHSITLRECQGEEFVLEALDPETGGIAWRRELGRLKDVEVSVTPDLIGIRGRDRGRQMVTVFDESGRRLAATALSDPPSELTVLEMLGRSGNRLFFYCAGAVYALPVGADTPLWRRPFDQARAPVMLSNGKIVSGRAGDASPYDVSALGRPGELSVLDLTGRQQVLPITGGGKVVGVIDDLVIIQSEDRRGTLISARRLRHGESASPALGGVPPEEWPAACGLLTDRQLTEMGRGYAGIPTRGSREVIGVRLPRASACRFATPSVHLDDIFEVRVQWVASDAAAARRLAERALPWHAEDGSVRSLGPGTYLYTPGVYAEEGIVSAVIKAVDRQVLMVSGRDVELIIRASTLLSGGLPT